MFYYKKEEFIEKEFKNMFYFVLLNMESYVMFENVVYYLIDIYFYMFSEYLLLGK